MTRFISFVQYSVKGKRVIIHYTHNLYHRKIVSNLITLSSFEYHSVFIIVS